MTLGESVALYREGVTCSQGLVSFPIGGDGSTTFQARGGGMKGFGENIHQQCGETEWSLGVNLCLGGQVQTREGGKTPRLQLFLWAG